MAFDLSAALAKAAANGNTQTSATNAAIGGASKVSSAPAVASVNTAPTGGVPSPGGGVAQTTNGLQDTNTASLNAIMSRLGNTQPAPVDMSGLTAAIQQLQNNQNQQNAQYTQDRANQVAGVNKVLSADNYTQLLNSVMQQYNPLIEAQNTQINKQFDESGRKLDISSEARGMFNSGAGAWLQQQNNTDRGSALQMAMAQLQKEAAQAASDQQAKQLQAAQLMGEWLGTDKGLQQVDAKQLMDAQQGATGLGIQNYSAVSGNNIGTANAQTNAAGVVQQGINNTTDMNVALSNQQNQANIATADNLMKKYGIDQNTAMSIMQDLTQKRGQDTSKQIATDQNAVTTAGQNTNQALQNREMDIKTMVSNRQQEQDTFDNNIKTGRLTLDGAIAENSRIYQESMAASSRISANASQTSANAQASSASTSAQALADQRDMQTATMFNQNFGQGLDWLKNYTDNAGKTTVDATGKSVVVPALYTQEWYSEVKAGIARYDNNSSPEFKKIGQQLQSIVDATYKDALAKGTVPSGYYPQPLAPQRTLAKDVQGITNTVGGGIGNAVDSTGRYLDLDGLANAIGSGTLNGL